MKAEKIGHGELRISVEDSGPGIPDEKKGKLFARFQKSLDELSQGTGIGLSLCKKLIDLMDGTVELDPDYLSGLEGKPGAKFCIQLPCDFVTSEMVALMSTENQSNDVEVAFDASEKGKTERTQSIDIEAGNSSDEHSLETTQELPEHISVLFVDDDMVLRKLFARTINRAQPLWSVEEASNGETALMMVDKKNYDIIFVDQYMTSVEKQLLGTETTRMLRSKGVKSLICGLSANDMEQPFLSAGANAFMIKPFPCKPDLLNSELLRILNTRT